MRVVTAPLSSSPDAFSYMPAGFELAFAVCGFVCGGVRPSQGWSSSWRTSRAPARCLEDLGKLACQPLHRGRGGVASLVRRVACLPSVASIAVK
jgi:hypothetical protein